MGGVASGSYKAFAVVSFANHLNLYHTVESGSECRKRVRWSINGLLNYNSADWSGGTSGFLDIQDVDGGILTAAKLGAGNVAVYGDKSIHIQSWVGGDTVYRFDKMITNMAIPSRRGIVANDVVHYILARDNIYEYWGGRDLRPIGDAIKARYTQLQNPAGMDYAFMEYMDEDDELRVHIPTGTSTQPDTCLICKVKENYAWYEGDSGYTAPGVHTTPSALTIGELQGAIGAQNWRFGDLIPKIGANVYLLGDPSGRVVKRDKTVYSVSKTGTAGPQEFIFNTKDLSSIGDMDPLIKDKQNISHYMDNESRWLTCTVEAKGYGSMYLEYSTDGGEHFLFFDESPITLEPNWTMHDVDIDRASSHLMIRISNAATNEVVHVRYIKAEFIPGGEAG